MSIVIRAFAQIGWWIVRRGWTTEDSIEVPLSDDLAARLIVLPVVADALATQRVQGLAGTAWSVQPIAPTSIDDALQAALDRVLPVVKRCRCHRARSPLGPVWEWSVRGPYGRATFATPTPPSVLAPLLGWGEGFTLVDDFAAALPFMCPLRVQNAFYSLASHSISTNGSTLETRRMNDYVMGVPPFGDWLSGVFDGCSYTPHVCPTLAPWLPPKRGQLSATGFGVAHTLEGRYGYVRQQSQHACCRCFITEPYALNPSMWSCNVPDLWAESFIVLRSMVQAHLWASSVSVGNRAIVHVTAWEPRYGDPDEMPDYGRSTLVLVSGRAAFDIVDAARGRTAIVLPVASQPRFVGAMRGPVACSIPAGMRCVTSDTSLKSIGVIDIDVPNRLPWECSPTHINTPCVDQAITVAGAFPLMSTVPLARWVLFGSIWGFEEAALGRVPGAAYRVDANIENPIIEWSAVRDISFVHPPVWLSPSKPEVIQVVGNSMFSMMLALHEVRARRFARPRISTWLAGSALPLGTCDRNIDLEIRDIPAPSVQRGDGDGTLSALLASEIGAVRWYVFGSRGDVVPCLALARVLAGWGLDVQVIRPHTEAEGTQILAAAETGSLLSVAGHFFRLVGRTLADPGLKIGPPEAWGVDVGVSLRPPASVVHPADFGIGWLGNFFINDVLRSGAPLISIGAYPGIMWMPRSADGVSFLPKSTRSWFWEGDRPIDVGVAWGSSSLPRPTIVGSVDAPVGDHVAFFKTCKVVVTSGGAGTVQTAAACGARVIAATAVLDRRYRNPLNAGLGVAAGADPDKIMLVLLNRSVLAWVWAWKHSTRMFFNAVAVYAQWHLAKIIWLLVLLAATVRARSAESFWLGPSLAATVAGNLLLHELPSWLKWLVAPRIYEMCLYLMAALGMTRLQFLLEILKFVVNATTNPLWWFVLAWSQSLLVACCVVWLSGGVAPIVAALQMAVSVISVAPTGLYACVGVTYAFQGLPIPAMHVRLISSDRSRKLEGEWVAGYRGLYQPYRVACSDYTARDNLEGEWTFPTNIPWSAVEGAGGHIAPYSPTWNCQSALLAATRLTWGGLGVAGWVLMPIMLWGFVASSLAALFAAMCIFLLDVVPALGIMLHMVVPDIGSPALRAMAYKVLDDVVVPGSDYWTLALRWTAGYGVGWNRSVDIDCVQHAIHHLYKLPITRRDGWSEFLITWQHTVTDPVVAALYHAKLSLLQEYEATHPRNFDGLSAE